MLSGESLKLSVHAVHLELLEVSLAVEVARKVEGGSLARERGGDGRGRLVDDRAGGSLSSANMSVDVHFKEIALGEAVERNVHALSLVDWVTWAVSR